MVADIIEIHKKRGQSGQNLQEDLNVKAMCSPRF